MKEGPEIVYRDFKPHSDLADFIMAYWYFRIDTDSSQSFEILPDSCFDLLIIFSENEIEKVKITGLWTKQVTVSYSEKTEILGIRFKPLAINALLDFSVGNLLNESIEISLEQFYLSFDEINTGISSFPGSLINYLDDQFLGLLNKTTVDERLRKLYRLVDSSEGTESVKNIAETIGISSRQLQRIFKENLGIGLKEYLKIVRFKKTLRKSKSDKSDYLPYFDQAHFIKEVKTYTGNTPDKIDLNRDVRFLQYYDFKSD